MPRVTITKSELKSAYSGQEVVMSEENTVYVKPLDVKQKMGIPSNFEIEIVEDQTIEEVQEEDPDPFE